jgi:hypothetical protein
MYLQGLLALPPLDDQCVCVYIYSIIYMYLQGLLALALLDDQYADEAVRRNIVPRLLRRLRGLVFEVCVCVCV